MKLQKVILILTSLFFLIFLTNCEGDEGPMGPPGPVGPKGDKGDPGISNIISVTYEVYKESWTGDNNGYSVTLEVPEITQSVFDYGAVLIYFIREDISPATSNLLPYTYLYGNSAEYMDADIFVGGVKIFFRWVDNGINSTQRPNSKFVYKIVIFEGTPISVLKSKYNITTLKSLSQYFNIQ